MARICVFGPHPDDQELGMGATIAKLAEQGHDVLLVDVTNGEPTPMGDPATRAREAQAALDILAPRAGSGRVRRVLLGLPNRFVEHTIEARHALAGVILAHQAEILFTPYFEDAHPDHRAVTRLVEDARFDAKLSKLEMPTPPAATLPGGGTESLDVGAPTYPRWLFYYYATHLRWVADPSFLIDVTGYTDRKRDAIKAYQTQFVLPEKNRGVVAWVDAAATYFGSRLGTQAAEAFFTKEPIGLTTLDSLPL